MLILLWSLSTCYFSNPCCQKRIKPQWIYHTAWRVHFIIFFINIYYLGTEIHDDIFVTLEVERLFSDEFCIPDVQTRTRGLNGIRKWRLCIRLSWNLKFKNTTSRPFGNFFVFRWQSTINEFCISHQKFWACVVWNTI